MGHADYVYLTNNVEAMTDAEIAQELGCGVKSVERMRSDLGLKRPKGWKRWGKITSAGIEPIATFEARMKARLKAEGIAGDEARMFMRSFLLDRAKEIERCEFRLRMSRGKVNLGDMEFVNIRALKAECYFKLNSYERRP